PGGRVLRPAARRRTRLAPSRHEQSEHVRGPRGVVRLAAVRHAQRGRRPPVRPAPYSSGTSWARRTPRKSRVPDVRPGVMIKNGGGDWSKSGEGTIRNATERAGRALAESAGRSGPLGQPLLSWKGRQRARPLPRVESFRKSSA